MNAEKTFVPGALLLAAVWTFFVPQELTGQSGGRDFLFGEPNISLGIHMGYGIPRGGSEIFDFVTNEFTLNQSDFNAPVFGGTLGLRVTNRMEVALDVSYSNASTPSEFRKFVGSDDLPIEQNTRLAMTPVTLSLKTYLFERGRRISRFAWVPGTWSPFVGLGGGRVYYDFKQAGEFVDFDTYEIFYDVFRSKGDTGILHVLAGAEYSLSPSIYLTGEGRYSWAEARMGEDFMTYDPTADRLRRTMIDLSGFQANIGLAVRF